MKEQIIHLDPHDDFVSARDKMGWVQTQRVMVVWPPRGRVLGRRLDLVLLHRHAHRLGAQFALITTDAFVRELADGLGLPVFDSIDHSRRERWRSRVPRTRPERRQPRPDVDAIRRERALRPPAWPGWAEWTWRSAAFAFGLAALLWLAYTLIPSATVTLTPAAQPITARAEITADPNVSEVSAEDRVIPARSLRVEIENSGFVPTSGRRDVPDEQAAGRVVFTNLIGTAADIPPGTSVRTTTGASIRFTTTRAASVEARLGATVEVEIRAVERGPSGNVAANLINAIDGPLGLQLAVTNPTATRGGGVTPRAAVTAADRQRARDLLLAQIEQKAAAALEAQLQPGELLVTESITLTETLEETYSQAAGEVADTVALTLRIAVTGLVVDEDHARQVAQAALVAQTPAGTQLLETPITFAREPGLALDAAGLIQMAVTAQGIAVPSIDRDLIRELTRGLPVAEAEQRLTAGLPLAARPEITLAPEWLGAVRPALPWLPIRIHVIVHEAAR